MKPLFIVGTCAFAASVGLVIWGNASSGNKAEGKVAASHAAAAVTGTSTVTPDVAAGTLSETAGLPATKPGEPDAAASAVYRTVVLGEGRGGFRLNALVLSDDAMAKIDELIGGMTEEDLASARIEIEGHTDNLGPKDVNDRIGLARALAVKMYLCAQFEVDPRQIKVVSYGSAKPVANNATQEGRALNRRVVVNVVK
jgi:outer membrane protein OmpA-like peptidoglycan-associated protein